jgi:hypothetical protein
MRDLARTGRTARLLEARLETLAIAAERAPRGARTYEAELCAAQAATRHAVTLRLLSSEQADAIWAQVAGRHPGVGLPAPA